MLATAGVYGITYGVHRTTIYLSEKLRSELARAAKRLRMTEAAVLRQALEQHLAQLQPPAPRIPLFRSKARGLAEHVDDALVGFGER
jgi:hypothetical protein